MITNLDDWEAHVLEEFPKEACGFVKDGLFIPALNIALDPLQDFKISGKDYLRVGNIEGIVHSHPKPLGVDRGGRFYDQRTPSMADLRGQQDTDVAWGISSTDGEVVSNLLWFGHLTPEPLLGRPFIHNVYDCYTLVRDYYLITFGIKLGVYPRPPNWQEFDKNIYEKNYQAEGFRPLINTPPQVGDLIFFKVLSKSFIDHAGIYMGDGKFMHHQYNRLSTIESLDRWSKHIAQISHNIRVDPSK